jgi:hypothetical protein
MEWQLPIQKVEIGNIHIGTPWARGTQIANQKPMVPLSYIGTHFRMPFITLLFPPLAVVEYVPHTGRLVLDMSVSSLACIKLNTLQETLINVIADYQQSWFKTEFPKEQIRDGFQPIIENNKIILHCPQTAKGIPCYQNEKWDLNFSPNHLEVGKRIRVAIKIHGISFLTKPDNNMIWTGKCRLQHRVQGIIAVA